MKFSPDKIFVTQPKVRHLFPPNFLSLFKFKPLQPSVAFLYPLKTSENLKVLKILSKESFIYSVRKTFRKINIFYFPITLWQSDKKINVLLISARSIIWSVYYIKQKFLTLISANIFFLERYFCWVGTLITKVWFYIFQKSILCVTSILFNLIKYCF